MKYIRFIVLFSFLSCTLILAIVFLMAKFSEPPAINAPETTILYDSSNQKIGEMSAQGKRHAVSLENISPYLIQATLAIEDQTFYQHYGFDIKRILGALWADVKAMAKVQGASTITQQYAKNLYLTEEKTITRKLKEAWYTILLELHYTKEEILTGYFNTIYYGHGIYGVEAAAQFYFGKSAQDVTLAEAAMLAGIPKGPTYYSPYNDKEKSVSRQQLILTTMAKAEMISPEAFAKSSSQPLTLQPFSSIGQKVAPYFQDEVKKELLTKAGITEEQLEQGGLHIYTTLDTKMQQLAEEEISRMIPASTAIETALVAMNPHTGEVKALVGGRDYAKSPFNRATQGRRQPGSTFKPFLYYAALEHGYTPITKLKSEPTTFHFGKKDTYKPANYHGYYANDFLTLVEAMAMSDNIYAVKTHLALGMNTLVETAQKFGISSKLDAVPSLALGVAPVSPMNMVSSYGMIVNGGKEVTPTFVKRVVDKNGNVLYDAKITTEQVLNPQATFVLTDMMTKMFDTSYSSYTHVTGASITDSLTRHYAGKSGSTNTDSWMIGFSPELVSGVWIGYDKGEQITNKGEQTYSKKIWAHFMEAALRGNPVRTFQPPKGVVLSQVGKKSLYFVKGTEPAKKQEKKKPWWQSFLSPWL